MSPPAHLMMSACMKVFMMKIDVEGFEAHVVAGGLKMFAQSPPPVVTMEYFADIIDSAGEE